MRSLHGTAHAPRVPLSFLPPPVSLVWMLLMCVGDVLADCALRSIQLLECALLHTVPCASRYHSMVAHVHCTIGGTLTASQVGSVFVCLQLSSGLRVSGDLIRGLVRVSAGVRSAEGQ